MKKKIVGYADRISAAPGEPVRFMVSCDGTTAYEARIVRLVAGPGQADAAAREVEQRTAIDGRYAGRRQDIHAGSFALIEPGAAFADCVNGFTLQALIWPTMPGQGRQAILGQWSEADCHGYALVLDEQGALALQLGRGAGRVETVSTATPLLAREWYFVAATFDAGSGVVTLHQEALTRYPGLPVQAFQEAGPGIPAPLPADGPFLIAAMAQDAGAPTVGTACFDGKIEAPRVARRVLSRVEMEALRQPAIPDHLQPDLVAAWDFARDIETDRIRDASAHRRDGRLVNLPARAMTGHSWTGAEMNWRNAPDQYGAIHFHRDDLYDAAWQPDFELTVPEALQSGVYAARLCDDNEVEYVPFFVTPPRGAATADVLFLAPTASYMAYANEHASFDAASTEVLAGHLIALQPGDLWLNEHRECGYSLYDRHADGSGVCYSSRLRPILNMRPDHVQSWSGVPWQFSADLHIIGWLEATAQRYDVLTDEDLHRDGLAALQPYRVVITGTHPEYYSTAMWNAVDAYLRQGGRLMYLGGNGFYWRIAYHPTLPGVIELRRAEDGIRDWTAEPGEYYHSFTGEYGGLWRRLGRPPQVLAGVGMAGQGFDMSSYFRRQPGADDPRAAFIFEGVRDEIIGDFGLVGGGAAGIEVDRYDRGLGSPPHGLVLARSEGHTNLYFPGPEDVDNVMPNLDAPQNPLVRADMVFFETPKGGAVFSTGSISWAGSLSHNGHDNNVARITGNVLRRFRDPTPF